MKFLLVMTIAHHELLAQTITNFCVRFRLGVTYAIKNGNIYLDLIGGAIIIICMPMAILIPPRIVNDLTLLVEFFFDPT